MRASKQVVQTAPGLGMAVQSVSKTQNKFTNYAQFHQESTPSSGNSSAHIDSALLLQKGAGARKLTAGKKLLRPASAKTAKSGMSKKSESSMPLTYQSWTTKEEKAKPAKKTRKRSRHPSRSRSASSSQIRTAVQTKFNNFVQDLENDAIEEEDFDLLQDSKASLDRDTKKELLHEQRVRRMRSEHQQKLEKEALEKHRRDNLAALTQSFKKQTDVFKKKQRREAQLKEKTQRRNVKKSQESMKSAPEEMVKVEKRPQTASAAKEMQDLRSWIEKQIQKEIVTGSVNEHDSTKNTATETQKGKSMHTENASILSNISMEELVGKKSRSLLKHQLPGNSLLSEEEEKKLGIRKNRFGVFPSTSEDVAENDFDHVVQIEKDKFEIITSKKAQTQPFTEKDFGKVQSTIQKALQGLKQRAFQKAAEVMPDSPKISDDSCDQVPVKEIPRYSAPKAPTEKSVPRQIINKPVSAADRDVVGKKKGVPGVVDTAAHYAALQKAKLEKESEASLVIQKWLRGHWGRRETARQRYKQRHNIEAEYGGFMQGVKFNRDFSLDRYLREKATLRAKNGLADSVSMDEISEAIGESSQSVPKNVSAQYKHALSNNFFGDMKKDTETDPLSLIAIYAKKHSNVPLFEKEPPRSSKIAVQVSRSRDGSSKRQKRTNLATSESIQEEIYSEFSESGGATSQSIPEDIPNAKASSSSSKAFMPDLKKTKVDVSDSILDEVIEEESMPSAKSSSIHEESFLQGTVASSKAKGSSRNKEEDSIIEESIIREEFDGSDYDTHTANQVAEARNRVRFGLLDQGKSEKAPTARAQKNRDAILLEVEESKEKMTLTRERLVGSLFQEMRDYERANMSEILVDRLEKICVTSLAKKDQLILAQRVAELEAEKRHNEEINRIREEQIRLMSQLMLLGVGGGQVQSNVTDSQRQIILEQIKALVERPVTVKQEIVHVNYVQAAIPPIEGSVSLSHSGLKRMSYLEEYDQQKKSVMVGNTSKFSDLIEEDIVLRSGKISVSGAKSNKSEDSIIDEVQVSHDESIHESIEGSVEKSQPKKTRQEVPKQTSFEDQKSKAYRQASQENISMGNKLKQLEQAITNEQANKKEVLKQQLRALKMSPSTFERRCQEVDRWAQNEQFELRQKQKVLFDSQKDVKDYLDNLSRERKSLIEKVAASPHKRTLDIEHDSADSEMIKKAMHQAHLIQEGLAGVSPEQKYSQKKRDIAEQLFKEKERAIQKGLEERLLSIEGKNAEEELQAALELDVEREVERRFEVLRKKQLEESDDSKARPKKNVKFQSPKKENSVDSDRYTSQLSNSKIEDSIGESIQVDIGESVSQSVRSEKPKATRFSNEKPGKETSVVQDSDSHISSEYSQDFDHSAGKESSVGKSSLATSKQSLKKLQAKAKEVEESNAYSESFEEESLGTSAPPPVVAGKPRMEPVKEEESIDESLDKHSASKHSISSKNESRSQSALKEDSIQDVDSLPSEDVLIEVSAHSVEWKFDVPQETDRQKSLVSNSEEKYSEDGFEDELMESNRRGQKSTDQLEEVDEEVQDESSDLDRDEMQDLESCPEEIGKSGSMSGDHDMLSLADQITEELFSLLVEEYKRDDSLDLNLDSVQRVDEEDFRGRFPWTLDQVVEVTQPTVTVQVKKAEPKKKAKTARELADDAFLKKHADQEEAVRQQRAKVAEFLDFLIKRVDLNEFVKNIDRPISQNPLKVLAQIQAYDDDSQMANLYEDTALMQAQQQILPQTFFNKVDREFNIIQRMKARDITSSAAEDSDLLTGSQEQGENLVTWNHYALFEGLNEALDHDRPYKHKGAPMPWSLNTRTVKQQTTIHQAKAILETAKQRVLVWDITGAGSKNAPLPVLPPNQQDEHGEEILPPPLKDGEEDRQNAYRQEKVQELMTTDIQDTDHQWVDYEMEENQTRFDLADMVLVHLAGEIAEFLMQKGK